MSVEDTKNGDDPDTAEEYSLYNIRSSRAPLMVTLTLNGSPISMELGTGAGISIVSKQTYNQLWRENKQPPLQPSSVHLNTYTGEKLPVLGVTNVVVGYKQQSEMLQLRVVDGTGPSLLERDWILKIIIDWHELNHLSATNQQLDKLLNEHSQVFKDELGLIKGATAKLTIDTNAQP